MSKYRYMPIITPEGGIQIGGYVDPTDPFGSYTGRPKDLSDKPVQDADDL